VYIYFMFGIRQNLFIAAFLVALLIAALPTAISAQATSSTCKDWFEPQTYQGAIIAEANSTYNRPAVIFGKRFPVGPVRIRLIDGEKGMPIEYKEIRIVYGWRWLEYPYSEHDWGAWNDTGDKLSCQLDLNGWIEAPAHEVQPRGWYNGKYTRWPWPKRPHFTEVEIVAVTSGGFARVKLKPVDLQKFQTNDLIVHVFQGWRTELFWQKK
jgi:hypothetical protein